MTVIRAIAGQSFTTELEGAPAGVTNWQVRIYDTADNVIVGPAADDFDTVTEDVEATPINPENVLYEVSPLAPVPAEGYEPNGDGEYVYTVAWMSDGQESDPDVLLVSLVPSFAQSMWQPPTIDDLASLMFARVTGEYGPAQTFTAESRPTADQAKTKLGQAVSMIAPRVGFVLDERFHDSARFVTVLYAALAWLEPGYWPEQASGDQSAWDQWKAMFDEAMAALLEAIRDAGDEGGDTGPEDDVRRMEPVWYFGPRCDDRAEGAEMRYEPVSGCRRVW